MRKIESSTRSMLSKKSMISEDDVEKALPGIEVETVPNDYQQVMQSQNVGAPTTRSGPT